MKTNNDTDSKMITPAEAIREFIQSYSLNMNGSLQTIINVINRAKNDASLRSKLSCIQQARDSVNSMKAGLEVMRKDILCLHGRNKNALL